MFPKWLQRKIMFFQWEEPQQESCCCWIFFLSILDLPPSLCQADRRVQSAGWGLHSGLMGDVCGPALKSSPSRPLEPLPVIL